MTKGGEGPRGDFGTSGCNGVMSPLLSQRAIFRYVHTHSQTHTFEASGRAGSLFSGLIPTGQEDSEPRVHTHSQKVPDDTHPVNMRTHLPQRNSCCSSPLSHAHFRINSFSLSLSHTNTHVTHTHTLKRCGQPREVCP